MRELPRRRQDITPYDMAAWRGIDGICQVCLGTGTRVYPSTATWRGGIGGAAMTNDVCDSCWGSGDASHPWTNLRALHDKHAKELAKANGKAFAKAVGIDIKSMHPAIGHLCDLLEKQARRRNPPTGDDWRGVRNWEFVCNGLASILRRAMET